MLSLPLLDRAVRLQRQSYALLRWMSEGIERGTLSFSGAHDSASLPAAALAFLNRHYESIPAEARPEKGDLVSSANLFATFLEGSFDLVQNPGKKLYSPEAHCFCPMCSWLVAVPHLRPKKLAPADKLRADRLELGTLASLATELGLTLPDSAAAALASDATLRETRALATYGRDLLKRLDGVSEGASTLALWRRFAWAKEGSPIKGFVLSAANILAAERTLSHRIEALSGPTS